MPLATLTEAIDRVDTELLFDLTLKAPPTDPPTPEETATRDAKLTAALEDASAELLGYKPRIASAWWPDAETLRTHCVRVALYLLTLRRAGSGLQHVTTARDAVIKFYEDAVERTAAAGGGGGGLGISYDAPDAVMTDDKLKGLT